MLVYSIFSRPPSQGKERKGEWGGVVRGRGGKGKGEGGDLEVIRQIGTDHYFS